MLIFLYGQDTYRLQQKLREIEQQYKKIHKGGLNLEKFDVLQIDFREFWNNLRQSSMFIRKKLFFLENIFSNLKFKEDFLKKVKEIAKSSDVIAVFEKEDLPKKDKLFQALKKYGKSQEFKLLGGEKLKDWIEKEFQKHDVIIDSKAQDKLVDFVGSNLWRMSNEIEKLTNYKKGTIREKDVELLVKPKIETAIFETIDALAQRNIKKTLRLVQNHLDKGDSPFYLLKMINFQFRNLLIAKALQEKGKTINDFLRLNICHPYAAKKSWFASAGFSLSQLKKIYQKIFEADLNIKTGKIKPEEGLRMLLTQI